MFPDIQWLLSNLGLWCMVFSSQLKRMTSTLKFSINWQRNTNLLKKFYWSIVDLQYYVSFRWTAKWISYTCTYIHYFLRFFSHTGHYRVLIRVPCAIYSRALLVMYFIYNSVYTSITISQFIPPFLYPLVIMLFSISVTLFLFCK